MKTHMKKRMGAFKRRQMHSRKRRTGPVVTSRAQAIRIALEEARKKGLKGAPPEKKKKKVTGMRKLIKANL